MISLGRGDIIGSNEHGRMIGQRLVGQLVNIIPGQSRQLGFTQCFRIDISAKYLVHLGCCVCQIILLRNHTGLRTRQTTFGLLQLGTSPYTGLVSIPDLSQDFLVRTHVFQGKSIKTSLLDDFEIRLYRTQGDIVSRVVDVIQSGTSAGIGLLDLVGRIVAVEQVLSDRQLIGRAVVVFTLITGYRGLGFKAPG